MGANFGDGGGDEAISGINVTPLVDVVLVLLVIFLITAPAIYQSAIKVQLPKAATGESGEKSSLSFTLQKDGSLSWGKEAVNWVTLTTRLKSMGNLAEQTATISADQATPHGTVVKLMDVLRQSGLTRFALTVEGQSAP